MAAADPLALLYGFFYQGQQAGQTLRQRRIRKTEKFVVGDLVPFKYLHIFTK